MTATAKGESLSSFFAVALPDLAAELAISAGGPGADPNDPAQAWKGRMGIDARWEHLLVAVDAKGNITEQFPQWDSLFRRPHAIYINPYDPQKHVWVVDDHNQTLFEFTNDLKQLVKTIGTKGEPGADDRFLQEAIL